MGEGGSNQEITVPDFPNEAERGEHKVVFQSPFYIERDDWRAEAEKGYRRLCPGQIVGLRHAGLVIEWVDSVCEGGKVRKLLILCCILFSSSYSTTNPFPRWWS